MSISIYYKIGQKTSGKSLSDSRDLAKMMFKDSYLGYESRDLLLKFFVKHRDTEDFIKSIAEDLSSPS